MYLVKIDGAAESAIRGNRPIDIDELLRIVDKNVSVLQYKIISKQIELLLQKGDTEGAETVLNAYITREEQSHPCPMNLFQHDKFNGGAPYIGAHMFFGAFREASKFLYPEFFHGGYDDVGGEPVPELIEQKLESEPGEGEEGKKKKKAKATPKGKGRKPSQSHLRKFVQIHPHHIFVYRDGKKIMECDEIVGQQPVKPSVSGFSKHEVIHPPFTFSFAYEIREKGPFFKLLSDREKVKEIIEQAVVHGIVGGRGVGFGVWNITKMTGL